MSAYSCPQGFDCVFQNACPAQLQECPPGFFCGSYDGFEYQTDLDIRYVDYKLLFAHLDIQGDDYKKFVEPDRHIQAFCVKGFYCPSPTEMLPCGEGNWCTESTVEPRKCDPLSVCSSDIGYFELNFINIVIAGIITLIIATASFVCINTQRKRNKLTRSGRSPKITPASAAELVNNGKSSESMESSHKASNGVEILLVDAKFSYSSLKIAKSAFSNVSAHIKMGSITAILGPSGAGKTTLLNLLRRNGDMKGFSGDILLNIINDVDGSTTRSAINNLNESIGFVPQEDILDRSLTLRELLEFNVRARTNFDEEECNRRVEDVMEKLKLSHVADTIIGGSTSQAANISGGQLKRANIAVELVAISAPALLLLDEPTGGLDASVTIELFEILHDLSCAGITIIMALQQPRPEIFSRLDNLMLLSADGQLVYFGNPENGVKTLNDVGFHQPSYTSDADFCIDVLNGIIDLKPENKSISNNDASLREGSKFGDTEILVSHWINESAKNIPEYNEIKKSFVAKSSINPDFNASFSKFCLITWLSMKRTFKIRIRSYQTLVLYGFIHILMAAALSSGFSVLIAGTFLKTLFPPVRETIKNYYPSMLKRLMNRNPFDIGVQQLLFFMSSSIGSAAALAATQVFSGRLQNLMKESRAGIHIVPSALGSILSDLIIVLWNSMLFVGIWNMFGHAGRWFYWLVSIVASAFAASGIGYLCGIMARPGNSSFSALIFNLVCCVFSGVEPRLAQVADLPVLNWIWYASYATWTAESIYYTYSMYLENNGNVPVRLQDGADSYGYDISEIGTPIGILIAIGIVLRLISILILYFKSEQEK